MGLFSKQKTVAKSDIPEEILNAVSVNGERKINVPTPEISSQNKGEDTTSPFLSKASVHTATPQPVASVSEPTPVPSEVTFKEEKTEPKPFTFSDQEVSSEAIHFMNLGTEEGKEEVKKVPDFSRVTEEPGVKDAKSPLLSEKIGEATSQTFWTKGNILSIGVFFLILGLISGGSWYYLNTRSSLGDTSVESMSDVTPELELETALEESETGMTISIDEANKLSLDVESVTLEDIKGNLTKEIEKMAAEQIVAPVEYLVTDLNDNKIAFSRFALLSRANVPDTLVNISQEPFSLYLYQDGNNPKVALAVALKKDTEEIAKTGINSIAQSFKDLLLTPEQAKSLPINITFNEGSYNGQKVYYYNVEDASATSFDITFDDGYIIIANSKNTLRAVFDKRN